jgi:predicted flap endonuclease-1-like 5' DNA nuclease
MNVWAALVLGILIGWLVEWAIDAFYWRKRGEKTVTVPMIVEVPAENEDLLQDIYGIGPVLADRFRKAGVTTFAQLAELNEEEIRTIARVKQWKYFDARSWLSQARDFAKRREEMKK